jgi:hypothetical protein
MLILNQWLFGHICNIIRITFIDIFDIEMMRIRVRLLSHQLEIVPGLFCSFDWLDFNVGFEKLQCFYQRIENLAKNWATEFGIFKFESFTRLPVSSSPFGPKGYNTLACGWGSGETQFRRRDKHSGTLCTVLYNPSTPPALHPPPPPPPL